MTLQHELHDLKNCRRFHIGFRGLPYPFYRRGDEDDATYHARMRSSYPNEEALRKAMLAEWERSFCEQGPEQHAYVGAVAAHAYRFCAEADWQIDCTSDSGDNYGMSGPRGTWPLVFSVYGDGYIDDEERLATPWSPGQERSA